MMDTMIVAVILAIVGFFAIRGISKTFKGEGGCGGSCACSEKKKSTCGEKDETWQELKIDSLPTGARTPK
ncbi:FeoB-associated Cys-rich membrane protein [Planctomycetota bacterium]